jgi:hypothetical protein
MLLKLTFEPIREEITEYIENGIMRSFKYYCVDHIKDDEVGETYRTHGRDEQCIEYSSLEASNEKTVSEFYIKMGS